MFLSKSLLRWLHCPSKCHLLVFIVSPKCPTSDQAFGMWCMTVNSDPSHNIVVMLPMTCKVLSGGILNLALCLMSDISVYRDSY